MWQTACTSSNAIPQSLCPRTAPGKAKDEVAAIMVKVFKFLLRKTNYAVNAPPHSSYPVFQLSGASDATRSMASDWLALSPGNPEKCLFSLIFG